MEENFENNQLESNEVPSTGTNENEAPEDFTLSDAITGILTEPGNTFESIKKTAKKNYWLIPILIFIVVSIASRFMVMNDEELYSEIKTKQTEAVKKRLDEQVRDGKMSREQANESLEQMEKGFNKSSPIYLILMIAGPIVTTFLLLFVKGLIFFGALKILKGMITYMQVITVLGLAAIIDSLQVIIDTVLAIITGRLLSNIGPTLIFPKDSLSDSLLTFLSHFDVFNIWYMIMIGIGFAVFSNLKISRTIPVVFVLWLIWVCSISFVKLPFFGG